MWGFLLQLLAKFAIPNLGSRLVGFLLGSKVKTIGFLLMVLALLGTIGYGYYKVNKWKSAEEEVKLLRKDIQALAAQMKLQNAAQKATERLLKSQLERTRRLSRELDGLLGDLKNVRSDGCLDKPVPAGIDRLLVDKGAGAGRGGASAAAGSH